MKLAPLPTSIYPTFVIALLAIAVAVIGMLPKTGFAYDQRIALLIGLGQYEGGLNKGVFRNLPVVANDLEAVGKALQKLGFNDIKIYTDQTLPSGSRFDYYSLLHAADTASARVSSLDIERVINQLLDKLHQSGKNNLLLVYFTGHGGAFGKADRVLVAPQSERSVPSSFYRVRRLLNSMTDLAPATDKMLVVDACADELGINSEGQGAKTDEEMPTFLFSSRAGEASFFDKHLGMSVFTHYFVDALTRAEDLRLGEEEGKIDSDGIKKHVHRYVPKHSTADQKKLQPEKNRVQHPYGSDGKPLVLAEYEIKSRPPRPGPEATDAQKEDYLRALQETYYGSVK